jgi:hypothetical protein
MLKGQSHKISDLWCFFFLVKIPLGPLIHGLKRRAEFRLRAVRFSSSNRIELLREFESICKTVLAHESGDPGVQFDEKTRGRKSRETVPLINRRLSCFHALKTYQIRITGFHNISNTSKP